MVTEAKREYVLTWTQVVKSDRQSVGGKAWNLGRLQKYGFKIPQGGVITAQAYQEFIKSNGLQEMAETTSRAVTCNNIDDTGTHKILHLLRQEIKEGHVPEPIIKELTKMLDCLGITGNPVAVRSSAAAEDSTEASFAGIHDSFLNVSSLEKILSALKNCYASLWTPKAVAYRRKMNIGDDEVSPAVVIMEMVKAEAAGVGFTCDPQSGRQDILVINANFGLGESVVTGAVDPDTYYLDATYWYTKTRIIHQRIGRKEGLTQVNADGGTSFVQDTKLFSRQVLPDKIIEKLGLLLLRVFDSLGNCEQHQDIEWVFDGQDIYLVQARPVTALPGITFKALENQPDIWSNGNLRDALPMVQSPLNRRLMKNFIDSNLGAAFKEIGYQLPTGLEFSKFFNGRLYMNLSFFQWVMYDCMGAMPRDVNVFWGGHQPEIKINNPKPYRGLAGLKRILFLLKAGFRVNKLAKKSSQIHKEIADSVKGITKGLRQLNDRELTNIYDNLGQYIYRLSRQFWFLSGAATAPVGSLTRVLTKYFGDRSVFLLNALMVGGKAGITSADHGYRLVELTETVRTDNDALRFFSGDAYEPLSWEEKLPEKSAFKQAFREFIREYGHRAGYELDIINPRWKEDPSYLMDIIRSTISTADLNKLKMEQKEKSERAWVEIKEKVPGYRHSAIRKWLKQAQSGAAVREMTKSILALIMSSYREIAEELGSRLSERSIIKSRSDVYFCTWPELFAILSGEWDGSGLADLAANRKADKRTMELISPPDLFFGETPKFAERVEVTSGNFLKGIPVAAGQASGRARLINKPEEGNRLQPGDVLVAPSTDPGWTPLFLKAGAVVMETGGFLSHGAIVAREYGIPAVVNIPGVLKVIKEGQNLLVDGDEGKIFLQ